MTAKNVWKHTSASTEPNLQPKRRQMALRNLLAAKGRETLLDNYRFALNGEDCSDVGNPEVDAHGEYVSGLMTSRLQNCSDAANSPVVQWILS